MAERSVGLASGLVETMREIGGAVGIAVVSTVLVARTRDAAALAFPRSSGQLRAPADEELEVPPEVLLDTAVVDPV